ncbi:ribose-5-phosphate isomerase A [Lacunimicrobium album]
MSDDSKRHEKTQAAKVAVSMIDEAMVVGLGSGSTAAIAIELLGERVEQGLDIIGVATSKESARIAKHCGIRLSDLSHHPKVDLTIDGADRFDAQCRLIKGGGGALLHEKIVAFASKKLIIIADSSKRRDPLGGFPVPVEVVPMAVVPVKEYLDQLGYPSVLRVRDDGHTPKLTDEANVILDLKIDVVHDPEKLAIQLQSIPGIVEHGLFLGMADMILFGEGDHVIEMTPS